MHQEVLKGWRQLQLREGDDFQLPGGNVCLRVLSNTLQAQGPYLAIKEENLNLFDYTSLAQSTE